MIRNDKKRLNIEKRVNEMVKVSVIVPVYNVRDYLKQCMHSISNQTLKDLEIICINDGSTDGSGQILDAYAAKDRRIKVVHKKNTGYGHTMNIGLDIAQGEYIGIVESDDFIENNMYEDLYRIAQELDLDFIKSNYWKYSNAGKVLDIGSSVCNFNTVLSRYENLEKIFAARCIWAGIYKREFLIKNQIRFLETPGASYQDTSFAFKTSVTAKRGYFTDNAYVYYRIDNENSSVKSKEKIFCVCDEMAECWRYLQESGLDVEQIYPYYLVNKKYIYMWNMRRLIPESRKIFVRGVRKELREDLEHSYMDIQKLPTHGGQDIPFFLNYPEGYFRYVNQEFTIVTSKSIEHLLDEIKQESCLYIYGAGKIGSRLKKYISNKIHSVSVQYLVTQKKENSLNDVLEITSKKLDISKVIVISVANGYGKMEMAIRAMDKGFDRVFVLDDDAVRYLREE